MFVLDSTLFQGEKAAEHQNDNSLNLCFVGVRLKDESIQFGRWFLFIQIMSYFAMQVYSTRTPWHFMLFLCNHSRITCGRRERLHGNTLVFVWAQCFLLNHGPQQRLLIGNHSLHDILELGGKCRLAHCLLFGLEPLPAILHGTTAQGMTDLLLGIFKSYVVPVICFCVLQDKPMVLKKTPMPSESTMNTDTLSNAPKPRL